MKIIITLYIVFISYISYFSVRAQRTYIEKMRVLAICSRNARKIILEGNNKEWRDEYKVIDRHSFDEITFKFWRPVKWFYKDIK